MYNKAGRPLNKSDITRRILAALLLGGSVSGFNSKNGGGMSWLSIDYLVSAMVALYNGGGKRDVPKICISKARSIFYTGIG
jgi:hypothetical protein